MSRLQAHLQTAGQLANEKLAQAVAYQNAEGGSFDTALLELAILTPLEIDALLPAACGLPAVPSSLLERTTNRPWEAIPPDLQEVGWVLPLARQGERVYAATHPDLPDDRLGKLYREVTGFHPMVTAECCMARLHAERSGTFMTARYADLAVRYLELLKRRDEGRRSKRSSLSSQFFLVEETAKRLRQAGPKRRAPDPAVVLAKQISKPRTRLALAREPDRITEALARAATIVAPRVALFGVKREGLRVLNAPGSSLRIGPGATVTVRPFGKIERAILGDAPLDQATPIELRECLELEFEVPCILEPVYVHGRSVLMLYIDRKGQAFSAPESQAARDLCDVAGRSLEEVLKLKHHKATIGSDLNIPRRGRRSPRRAPVVSTDGLRSHAALHARLLSPESQAILVIPPELTRREESEEHPSAVSQTELPEQDSVHLPKVRKPTADSPQDLPTRRSARVVEPAIPALVKRDTSGPRPVADGAAAKDSLSHELDNETEKPASGPEDKPASRPENVTTKSSQQTSDSRPTSPRLIAQEPEPNPKAEAKTSTDLDSDLVAPKSRRPPPWPDPSAPGARKRSPSRKSRHTPSARRDAEIDAAIAEYTIAGTSVSRLRALGTRALFRLATSFPGPLDISELNLGDLPPPAAHGPLLRACIELGDVMVPHILELFDHRRYLVRFYAAFVFQDLRDGRCIRPLSELAFDPEASVRLIAMRVLETYTQEEDFERVVARIRKSLNSVDRPRRIQAIDALGTLRDIRSIPQLIDLLEATDTEVQDTALGALCSITAQQLGYRASRWRTWYAGHSDRNRIDWLIEGLRHRDPAVRRWVADELARISNQDIDFPADGDRRDRDQAIKAWSSWWAQAQAAS